MSKRIRVPDEIADELQAMATVYREVSRLTGLPRERVWEYLWDRYVRNPVVAARDESAAP